MLVLKRKAGESLIIDKKIKISIQDIGGNSVSIGIEAPKEIPVYREELYTRIMEENRQAAAQLPIAMQFNETRSPVAS